jgi:uncharacterized coiled-coil protein SlyX
MAVDQKEAELKAQLAESKKRASDLQGDVDKFAKERKSFQNAQQALADAKAENKVLEGQIDFQNSVISDLESEIAAASKNLAKAEKKVAAAEKIKEGLAELS